MSLEASSAVNCSGNPPGSTSASAPGGDVTCQRVEADDLGACGHQALSTHVLGVADVKALPAATATVTGSVVAPSTA